MLNNNSFFNGLQLLVVFLRRYEEQYVSLGGDQQNQEYWQRGIVVEMTLLYELSLIKIGRYPTELEYYRKAALIDNS